MAMWRVRRIFSKPVALMVIVSALLVWASGFFYAELKVWMYGPQHVLTVGSSGRGLCIRRMDYQGVMGDMYFPPPADTYWPDKRWLKAAWLGPRAYWVTEWLPKFVRQKHGGFWRCRGGCLRRPVWRSLSLCAAGRAGGLAGVAGMT